MATDLPNTKGNGDDSDPFTAPRMTLHSQFTVM
jgi:hypothetical protein